MKYYEVNFNIEAPEEVLGDARDILSALAGEAGFETFEETENGLKGYVQQALFDRDTLSAVLEGFPFENVTIGFTVKEAEDKDWNAQWEQEGFEPITVGNIVIHDGRHLPQTAGQPDTIGIEIDAHLAFGTGTHETTRMMVAALLNQDLSNKRVLDCGTGTGILAIAALKLGAKEAVGYDIDEWSADNARHNAVINQVDSQFTSLLGDASLLINKVEGSFDVVMANINRNILLADMPAFVQKMHKDSTLLLSGFYQQDIAMLTEKAHTLGLNVQKEWHDGEWAALQLTK